MMLINRLKRFSLICLVGVSGCAGIGVVSTTNPLAKLNDAENLTFAQDRPIPAQRLIFEAIDIYKEQGDERGLGLAYRNYADLLKSQAVGSGKQSKDFRFLDQTITSENRIEKSKQYYSMAIENLNASETKSIQKNQYDVLTNTYLNIAFSYSALDNKNQACHYLDKSLGAYNENIKLNPSAKPNSPNGTVADYIAAKKKQLGCTGS